MKTKIIFVLFLLLTLACSEDDNSAKRPENPSESGKENPETVPESEIEVKTSGIVINPETKTILSDEWTNNIQVLDSADFNLQVNQDLIQKHNLKIGSILVSDKGEGFLRKVKNISTDTNGKLKIETESCSMEELFKEGKFRIATKNSQLKSSDSDIEISKKNEWSLSYDNNFVDLSGTYTAGNTMDISVSFKDYQLQTFSLSVGFINQLELNAGVKASGSVKKYLFVKRLPRINVLVGGVPVIIVPVVAVHIGASITGKPAPVDFNFLTGYRAEATVSYDGQWHYTSSKDYYQTFTIPELVLNDKLSAQLKVYIEPMLEFKIYGVLSPYFTLDGYGQIEAGYTKNPAWTAYVGAELGGGVKAKVFSKTIFDFNASFFEVKIPVAYGENYLSVYSGYSQEGAAGKPLPNPLVAQVTNTFNYPLSGYKVKFENISGDGKLSSTEATTNNNGEAAVTLTLNSNKKITDYTVQASAVEKNDTPHKGNALKNSPVSFVAQLWDGDIDETYWMFTLKSSQGKPETSVSCTLKENGVAQIGGRDGTYSLSNNSLTINWIANLTKPPGCTIQLKGTINGTSCSGTYTHWDYDDKGARFVWDSGTFTGYLSSVLK